MSHVPYVRAATVAIAPSRAASILAGLAEAWRRYRRAVAAQRQANETVRLLMSMSNRGLKDLGISRGEILSIVYGPSLDRRRPYRSQE